MLRAPRSGLPMLLLGLGVAGCFSTGATPASVVIPADPTELAKCKVGKN